MSEVIVAITHDGTDESLTAVLAALDANPVTCDYEVVDTQ